MSPSPEEAVRACIESYFRGLFQSDPELLRQVFHPDARVVGPDQGELKSMDREQFVAFAEKLPPLPPGQPAHAEVLALELAGSVATARVEDDYIGRRFVDLLSLVEIEGRWQIYTKLWHVKQRL